MELAPIVEILEDLLLTLEEDAYKEQQKDESKTKKWKELNELFCRLDKLKK